MRQDGFNVRTKKGIFYSNGKAISHSWIEYNQFILEQDCNQLGILGDSFQLITDPQVKSCYEEARQ
jgi:hypothetical protein